MKNNRYAEYLLQNYYYSNFSMFRDIELIISGDCNLNCKYCYLWKNNTWTLRKGIHWIQDKVYEAGTRRVQKKKKRKKQEGKK